jgi:TatD DNase family protein
MFDTHCHLDLEAFDADRDAVVERALATGVTRILVPGVDPRTWGDLERLGDRVTAVRIALGVHPQLLPDRPTSEVREALAALPRRLALCGAVAVGETGLDGPSAKRGAPLAWQEEVLLAHLAVARDAGLPVVLHCVSAHDAMLRVLRREAPVRGVLHAYSGSAQLVPLYAACGVHFSFAGPITWPGARRPLEAARQVAPHRLLAETDSPDQAPHPHRGVRNEPGLLPHVLRALAVARREDADEVRRVTTANALALFGGRGHTG